MKIQIGSKSYHLPRKITVATVLSIDEPENAIRRAIRRAGCREVANDLFSGHNEDVVIGPTDPKGHFLIVNDEHFAKILRICHYAAPGLLASAPLDPDSLVAFFAAQQSKEVGSETRARYLELLPDELLPTVFAAFNEEQRRQLVHDLSPEREGPGFWPFIRLRARPADFFVELLDARLATLEDAYVWARAEDLAPAFVEALLLRAKDDRATQRDILDRAIQAETRFTCLAEMQALRAAIPEEA